MVDLSIKDANAAATSGGCGCGNCGCGGGAEAQATEVVAKTCNCGPDCTCGCNEGKPCTCGAEAKADCGCGPDCTCGCQEGKPCTCGDAKASDAAPAGATVAQYTVSGMTCSHCTNAVTEEVSEIPGVTGVDVDLDSGSLKVTSDAPIDFDRIVEAVAEAGDYTVS